MFLSTFLEGFQDRIGVLLMWQYGCWNRNLGFLRVGAGSRELQRLELKTVVSRVWRGHTCMKSGFVAVGNCVMMTFNNVGK